MQRREESPPLSHRTGAATKSARLHGVVDSLTKNKTAYRVVVNDGLDQAKLLLLGPSDVG
jgi:hypothetical protein